MGEKSFLRGEYIRLITKPLGSQPLCWCPDESQNKGLQSWYRGCYDSKIYFNATRVLTSGVISSVKIMNG